MCVCVWLREKERKQVVGVYTVQLVNVSTISLDLNGADAAWGGC